MANSSFDRRSKVAGATFILFFLSLILSAYSARNPAVTRIGSVFVAEALRPFQLLNRSVQGGALSIWDSYINLIHVRDENRLLRKRLAALEAENSRLLELEKENARLLSLLGVVRDLKRDGIAARVIGYDASNWIQEITVDRGTVAGSKIHMPVLDGEGVVGQVVATSPFSSRVLLVTDRSSGVAAIVQESRARGVVVGAGEGQASLEFVSRDEPVRIGDRVITSGFDGIYPKGLLVGVVEDVQPDSGGLFHRIRVRPSVDFDRLETVLLVSGVREEEEQEE